jgi:ubiquinone/menaquinone biosynthesis C-methylase UbiE
VRTLGAVKAYYDRRAPEYDDWYLGTGLFAARHTSEALIDHGRELAVLLDLLATMPPARTLDVACGTGFLTRHLPGSVVGLDQSERMLEVARRQAPNASYVRGDGLELPFAEASFQRAFSGHFYGHLEEPDRLRFLAEARRVARELVIVDAALRPDRASEEWQERVLSDGSRWQVFKRFFAPERLLEELGGGETLHAGRWFVAVRSPAGPVGGSTVCAR